MNLAGRLWAWEFDGWKPEKAAQICEGRGRHRTSVA
jgi:hypothetical protein